MSESEADARPVAAVEYGTGTDPRPATLHDVAVAAVKLIGVYALVQAAPYVAYVPQILGYLRSGAALGTESLTIALYFAVWVAAGVALLFNAQWVVARLIRVPGASGIAPAPGLRLQAIALSVAGAVIAVWGLAALAGALAGIMAERQGSHAGGSRPYFNWLAEPVVEIILGLVLFLRAPGIAALWHRLQTAGLHPERESGDSGVI